MKALAFRISKLLLDCYCNMHRAGRTIGTYTVMTELQKSLAFRISKLVKLVRYCNMPRPGHYCNKAQARTLFCP